MLDVLKRYNAQPHNFQPNSWLYLAAHVALCEGYLGIPPSIELAGILLPDQEGVRKSKGPLALCGSISFNSEGS
jgi:Putative gypsy type transposon.